MNWAISTWTGTLTTDRRIPTPVSGYDAATTAWVAAVGSGNVTTDRKDLIDALIKGLKTDGIWTKLDRLWIFAAENSTCALTDLKGLAVATAVNSPSFSADDGYTGNGSTSYINTNYKPATHGVNYTLNAACFGVWDITTSAISDGVVIGIDYYGHLSDGLPRYSDGNSYWRVNSSGATMAVTYPGPGLYIANRSDVNNSQLYRNGSSVATSGASTLLPDTNFYVLGKNQDYGTPTMITPSVDQIAAVVMGGTLTGAEHSNLYTRLRTYMTAVGVP